MSQIGVETLPLTERNSRLLLGLIRETLLQRNQISGQVRWCHHWQQTDQRDGLKIGTRLAGRRLTSLLETYVLESFVRENLVTSAYEACRSWCFVATQIYYYLLDASPKKSWQGNGRNWQRNRQYPSSQGDSGKQLEWRKPPTNQKGRNT